MLVAVARQPRRIVVAAAGVVLVTVVLVGQLAGTGRSTSYVAGLVAPVAVAYLAMGLVVLAGVPRHPVGRLMVAAGASACVATLAASWSAWLPMAWLSQWTWWPPFGLTFLALLVFPDGRLPSPRWRWLAYGISAATIAGAVALAVAAVDHPRSLVTDPDLDLTARAQTLFLFAALAIALACAGLLGVLASLWVRWRRAGGDTRSQLACLLAAGALMLVALIVDTFNLPGARLVLTLALPLAMTVAVLRYHLYGLDQVINRTIVWLVMTLLVVYGYVALVALLRQVMLGGSLSTASLVATGFIAVTFEPLRRRVQRVVDQLVYGDRDDPYEVIARLGNLLGRTGEPRALLPLLTGSIAGSLRVPYVAVELDGREGARRTAEYGTPTNHVEAFEVLARGQCIGRLLVANRSPGGRFTRRERRLLKDAALHAGLAAEATRMVRDLQSSRERLVMAREEERRRLRRELHDGVGPALAGMAMQVRAAAKLIEAPSRAGAILDVLRDDLRACTSEVRQLVDQLRPPMLDHGLETALRAECQRFDGPALTVTLHIPQSLDGLTAATEVAAYRIVAEALTNVARHAQAHTCVVTVRRLDRLYLEIVDDGIGVGAAPRPGVGMESMRERVAELNGDATIGPAEPRGTAVQVWLPLEPVAPATPEIWP